MLKSALSLTLLLASFAALQAAYDTAKPSLPATTTTRKPNVPAPTKGVSRIEAESLRAKHAKITGGELRTQDMAGFKNDT